ncbi:LysR family transcriptional regulator [Roseomonas gilardii]|uniref:LysR family transcriptional regulator n=1 Tax=Roseomonas gilardii TaxID=257708 RepID=A0A1L7AI53_9PROT|nr:LysR family transcriptional regulator [Roseomonas gilardii]APT58486.1 LysR family transcriptional regulator [Roseomonas gilardii]MDT8333827.1 LysR family transcriptional regulator [Roseomonas gilardii]PZR14274.1 MAG: LysR family transcriptional regulator [Azospirillum brasilense]
MITLDQLRCFLAVAEEMNFRRAALRLNMTQPPLSRQIQALEHGIGTLLIDRSRRAIRLTPAGQSFLRSARRILEDVAGAAQDACRIASGDAGQLTLAFTAASSYVFLPRLVTLLRQRLPAINLVLREMTTPQQLAALQGDQIDLGLLRPPVTLPGMRAMRVYREPLVLALPSGHRLAQAGAIRLGELAAETLITYPPVEGPYLYGLVDGLLRVAGVTPAAVQYVTQTHSIMALVGAGLGVALLPQSAERFCPPDITFHSLVEEERASAELMLAWRTGSANPLVPVLRALLAADPQIAASGGGTASA